MEQKCNDFAMMASKEASACPYCGKKPVMLFLAAGIWFFMGLCLHDEGTVTKLASTVPMANTGNKLSYAVSKWSYYEEKEKMGRGLVKTANVLSNNEIELVFPYDGQQRGALQLRNHPEYGKDVIVSLQRGQFLCGIDECPVWVRFDQGKMENFSAIQPPDQSNALIIQDYDRFITELRKAKKVAIGAQFYQEGNPFFEFDVAGLKW
jgi:hypothetical protein